MKNNLIAKLNEKYAESLTFYKLKKIFKVVYYNYKFYVTLAVCAVIFYLYKKLNVVAASLNSSPTIKLVVLIIVFLISIALTFKLCVDIIRALFGVNVAGSIKNMEKDKI
jgi:hypothetical protein